MENYLLKSAALVNEGTVRVEDVLIRNGKIERIAPSIEPGAENLKEIDCSGLHLFPGMIDDQVHFREPGLTHKGDIHFESRAAAAGGITSFMEMPNTIPNALTQELLEDKYRRAAETSLINYSFYMGVSNTNAEEVLRTDRSRVCGIKIFMGSSTGNMLVDKPQTLERIFRESESLIAVHCEDEATIHRNLEAAKLKFGTSIPPAEHAVIRNAEACYLSSSMAVALAERLDTRLHILHISTARELDLFRNDLPLLKKRITAEVCIHHLWFSEADYATMGNRLKWNPAVKTAHDRETLLKGLLDGRLDVIATDHAPHLPDEKDRPYLEAASGGPMVQHALVALLDLYHQGKISLETIACKTSHAVADCFKIENRGYIREGYQADLVLADLHRPWTVDKPGIRYKCGWSPFEGHTFRSEIVSTFVNGTLVYSGRQILESEAAQRLSFTV